MLTNTNTTVKLERRKTTRMATIQIGLCIHKLHDTKLISITPTHRQHVLLRIMTILNDEYEGKIYNNPSVPLPIKTSDYIHRTYLSRN